LRAETDRVFDSFLGRGFGRFPALERVEGSDAVVPSIDVHETETELDDVSCSSSDHTEHSPPLATGR
jgi:hypothetical protein